MKLWTRRIAVFDFSIKTTAEGSLPRRITANLGFDSRTVGILHIVLKIRTVALPKIGVPIELCAGETTANVLFGESSLVKAMVGRFVILVLALAGNHSAFEVLVVRNLAVPFSDLLDARR